MRAGEGAIGLTKAIEDEGQRGGGHPGAGITDDDGGAVGPSVCVQIDATARWCERNGIGEEGPEHLLEATRSAVTVWASGSSVTRRSSGFACAAGRTAVIAASTTVGRCVGPSCNWNCAWPYRTSTGWALIQPRRAELSATLPVIVLSARGDDDAVRARASAAGYFSLSFLYALMPAFRNLIAFLGPPVPVMMNFLPRCLL